jgi:hypothetical protein
MEMGTEILLARMKEYPEEFINVENRALGYDGLRWDRVLRDAREHLPKEDVDALDAGMRRLYIDRFNERVLKTLAGESEPEQTEGTITYKASGRYATGAIGASDPRALFGTPQADAHQEYMNEMARQQKLMNQMEMQQQRQMMNSKNQVNTGGMSSLKNFFSRGM